MKKKTFFSEILNKNDKKIDSNQLEKDDQKKTPKKLFDSSSSSSNETLIDPVIPQNETFTFSEQSSNASTLGNIYSLINIIYKLIFQAVLLMKLFLMTPNTRLPGLFYF